MRTFTVLLALALPIISSAASPAKELNLYSTRHYDSDKVLYADFSKQTGIKVNVLELKEDQLQARVVAEGKKSKADVILLADASRLWRAQEAGLFQPVKSPLLDAAIPAQFKDAQNRWFGFSKRARVIIYNKKAGLPVGLTRYEDLAKPAYAKLVCTRPSANEYSQSLLASIIAANGENQAVAWVKGMVANFARKPVGNDTAQIKAVAEGVCRTAIVNTYYLGRFIASTKPEEQKIAAAVGVLFPNQADRGTHVNISGGGVAAHAPHKQEAVQFLEFLASAPAQAQFAMGNNEYPVVAGAAMPASLKSLGDFKADVLSIEQIGKLSMQSAKVAKAGGWE